MEKVDELSLQFNIEEYMDAQIEELRIGMKEGLPYALYDDPEFDWYQMKEIRVGLERKVDISLYDRKEYDYLLMREFRKGLEAGVNLFPYYEKGYSTSILRAIRHGQENGIDLIKYAEKGYQSDQMEQFLIAIQHHIPLEEHVNINVSGSQMEQLRLGVENRVDISKYGNLKYNWMQMQEIRLGLEKKLDVEWYNNILFSAKQMREIRLGLELGQPVKYYAKFSFGFTDMRRAREWIQQEGTEFYEQAQERGDIQQTDKISIRISEDRMHAFIFLESPKGNIRHTEEEILEQIHQAGVKLGIDKGLISQLLELEIYNREIEFATGKDKVDGEDGEYQYAINTNINRKPKLLPDGSVDYHNIDLFVQVKEGDLIATYIPPTTGIYGFQVTGEMQQPTKGKEQKKLHGKGVLEISEGRFIATMKGRIEQNGLVINIVEGYIHNGDLTMNDGNIFFDGDVLITGDVGDHVIVESTKNIEVEGMVGASFLKAGGDIIIKGGVNAKDEGKIESDGGVSAKFLERATIFAGKDIQSNYILHSNIRTEGYVIVSGTKGSIIGGLIEAVRGVDSFVIGNINEVETRISVGQNDMYIESLEKINNEIKVWQEKVDEIISKVKEISSKYSKTQLLEIPIYIKLLQGIAIRQDALNQAIQQRDMFMRKYRLLGNTAQVIAKGMIYPRTVVQINFNHIRVLDTYSNVTIRLDGGKVRIYGFENKSTT